MNKKKHVRRKASRTKTESVVDIIFPSSGERTESKFLLKESYIEEKHQTLLATDGKELQGNR